ncbi:MAG: T9SS type A sorting domain-containing protein [Ignavibacteriae bacterium]|nr:T9SS type A sorting domain-containing protein [Ignavibacteria bacterium]MBI3365947.1 T9SS type A sorting domain-containing protein [Ignavibacteriota bacterium]
MRRFIISLIFVLVSQGQSQTPTISISVLDTSVQFPLIPTLSGRTVAFDDYRAFNYSLHTLNIDTKQEQFRTHTGFTEPQVRISGNRVVWVGYPTTTQADVYTFNLSTDQTLRLTDDSSFQNYPDIQGDRVVWQDYRNTPTTNSKNADIYMYDFTTDLTRQITTNTAYQSFPAIWGDRIVWQDYRNAVTDTLNADIYMYDLSTDQEIQITTNTAYQTYPDIWEDKIVWEDFRNGTGDIYMYDLGTHTERAISTFPAYKTHPAIYRDWIVWQDYRNGTNQADIYGFNLITNQEYPIVVQPDHQDIPQLDSNNVVWQDFRDNRQDLYLATMTFPPTLTLTSPNGGETWIAGSSNAITWSALGISAVKIEYSTNNGSTWSTVTSSTAASTGSYIWSVPNISTVQALVRISDTGNPSTNDVSNSPFTITSGESVSVRSGWNMLSVPLNVSDYRTTILFPGATSSAFGYLDSYYVADTLHNGVGYWLRFAVSQSVLLTGTLRTADTIPVSTGWNMIGSISQPVPVSSVVSEPPGMVTSSFFGYNGSYTTIDTIYPGGGYWVKVATDGTLTLSSTVGTGSSHQKIRIVSSGELPPGAPSLDEDIDLRTSNLPSAFTLDQNYPNPFNPLTVIRYQLAVESKVTLKIYNVLGQEVKILVSETRDAGTEQVEWNSRNNTGDPIASGVYFYRIDATSVADPSKTFTRVRKLVLLK